MPRTHFAPGEKAGLSRTSARSPCSSCKECISTTLSANLLLMNLRILLSSVVKISARNVTIQKSPTDVALYSPAYEVAAFPDRIKITVGNFVIRKSSSSCLLLGELSRIASRICNRRRISIQSIYFCNIIDISMTLQLGPRYTPSPRP